MKILITDIGNTFTKFCLFNFNYSKISNIKTLETKKISDINYIKKKLFFLKNNNIKNSLVASVVPKTYKKLKKNLKNIYKISTNEIMENNFFKPIKINLKKKSNLGSDRLANAIAVYKKYKSNCIVVDFGTATTFDVVTKDGIYNGGVIVPGIDISIKTIYQTTAKLPLITLRKIKNVVGKNTREAMTSGFFWGYSGIISNIIKGIEKESKKKYKIIFTGGYSNIFSKNLNLKITVNKNLTLEGIIEIFKINNNRYL